MPYDIEKEGFIVTPSGRPKRITEFTHADSMGYAKRLQRTQFKTFPLHPY